MNHGDGGAGVLRKTLLYSPASLLGPLIQLATIVILTHWLQPVDLGAYAIAVAVQDLAQIATLSWWSQYVLRYLDDQRPETRAHQDRTEIAVLAAAGLAQALAVAGVLALLGLAPAEPLLIASIALAGVARALVGHWSVRARAAEKIGLYALAQIGGPALTLALSLAGFALFAPSLTVAFIAMAIGHVVVVLPMLRGADYRGAGAAIDGPTLTAAFRYGGFTTLGTGLAWVSMQSVRFIADFALGAAAVGLLHVGWGVGQRLATQIGVLATTALFPIAAGRARSEGVDAGVRQLMVAGPLLLAVLAPATILAFALAAPAAALLVGPAYREATATILPLAALAGAIRVFRNHYFDEVLQVSGEPQLMAKLDGLEAVLTILLCLVGAWLNGLTGLVLGALAAAMITTLAAWQVVGRRHGPPLGWRDAIATLVASAAMTLCLSVLPSTAGLAGLLFAAAAAGMAYLAAYAAAEHQRLLAFLRSRRRGD